ncbi:MAG: hypothetical protein AAF636_13680 [Pseudomonadota bacterium]
MTRYFEAADGRGSNWAREQRKLFAKRREETQKRDQVEDRTEADLTAFATGSALATDIQVKAFSAKLNRYETANFEALMVNDEALDAVRARLEAMLNRAYVISDGRRVFKTEDGTQVFDEFGEEVGPEFVSPNDIDDSFPTWEDYSAELELEQSLKVERTEILEFQARLDEAQEQIENGDVTEACPSSVILERRRPELREGVAHLVGLIMRRICGEASVAFRWFSV